MVMLVRGVLVLVVMGLTGCARNQVPRVCFPEGCFQVEVVQTEEELQRGLMFRESLDPGHGMLFVFPSERRHSFWMKNTLIPLDMVWMDYARRVVHIEEHVMPCEEDPCAAYTPSGAALYVLEVNAGETERYHIQPGDRADFIFPASQNH